MHTSQRSLSISFPKEIRLLEQFILIALAVLAAILFFSGFLVQVFAFSLTYALIFLVSNAFFLNKPYRVEVKSEKAVIIYGNFFPMRRKKIYTNDVFAVGYKDKYKNRKGIRYIKVFYNHDEERVYAKNSEEIRALLDYYVSLNKSIILDTKNPHLLETFKK